MACSLSVGLLATHGVTASACMSARVCKLCPLVLVLVVVVVVVVVVIIVVAAVAAAIIFVVVVVSGMVGIV